jgi:transcriptional regulator with XRE-family HTH domain
MRYKISIVVFEVQEPFYARDSLPRAKERMITAAQMRAARALLGIDQREMADLSGLSVPTIQRMEASDGVIRGNVDSLMKLISAINEAGVELIGEGAPSAGGGRGIRLKEPVLKSGAHGDRNPKADAGRAT